MRVRQFVRAVCVSMMGAAVSCTEPKGPEAAAIAALNAADQSATVATAIPQAVVVKVTDGGGAPFQGTIVTFAVTSGGGSISVKIDTTNDAGIASAGTWTIGSTAGTNTVTATAVGLTGSPVTFTVTGTAGPATEVAAHAGNGQAGTAGVALPIAPAVIAKDAYSNPVAGASVTFAVTSGNGSVTGATATTDASGIATVGSWVLGATVGLNTLTATVTGMPTITFAATGQVGPVSMIAIQRQPSRASSGAEFGLQPIVRLTDANGNLTASTATVTASVASGSGTLSGTTVLAAVNGVVTFTNLAVTGTGATTLAFTATGVTPATSTSFAVADPAGAPTKLGVQTQAAGAVSGSAFATQPEIEVQDAVGTLVTTASGSVTAAIASGSGTLTGTTTVSVVNGMARFTDLKVTGSGTATLAFTASGLTGTTSASFAVTAAPISVIEVVEGDRQAVMAGGAVPTRPSVRVLGPTFQPVAGARVTFAVALGGGAITGAEAITNASGIATVGSWTLGPTGGLNSITAAAEGGTAAHTITIHGSACTGAGAGFRITLCFTSEMTSSQKSAFTLAAAKWESIITNEPADVTFTTAVAAGQCGANGFALASGTVVDDLLIFAAVTTIDGPGAVLGSAGPCFLRRAGEAFAVGDFTVAGQMRFDVADTDGLEATGRFNAVILHEMAHVLGIGTLWSTFQLLQLPSQPGGPTFDTHFSGANAIAGFDALGFTTYGANKVPVENSPNSGGGSINSHWRESVLNNELMTPSINAGNNPLTVLTIRSLEDLGYTVNLAPAESFATSALGRSVGTGKRLPPLHLVNDIDAGPMFAIDSRGRTWRIR